MQTIIRIAETISFLKISDIDPKTDIVAGDVNIVSFHARLKDLNRLSAEFIENKAVIVIIPESRSRTFKRDVDKSRDKSGESSDKKRY